ncbi:carbohydrate-binding protein, partial [Acinetobacter baumannii]
FKQRLVFANTKTSPNQMWFSRIGDDGNFLETTQDADAFSIASSSAQSDNILHLSQRGGVVALTGGAEFL